MGETHLPSYEGLMHLPPTGHCYLQPCPWPPPAPLTLPYSHRILFWTDWDASLPRIEAASMSGAGRRTVHRETGSGGWPNGLTVDYLEKRILWIDARSVPTSHLGGSRKERGVKDQTQQEEGLGGGATGRRGWKPGYPPQPPPTDPLRVPACALWGVVELGHTLVCLCRGVLPSDPSPALCAPSSSRKL